MTSLEKDIEVALKLLYKEQLTEEEWNHYNRIYPWSNEDIYNYYNYEDLTNKNALCITSSGDHILYAVAAGANNIDAFDKNRLCKYYAALKIALILSQDEKTFFKLINCRSKCIISKSINLQEIEPFIDETYYTFWKEITSSRKFKHNKILFRFDGSPQQIRLNYNNLRNSLNEATINYIDADANLFLKQSQKNYDAIFLSNIIEWEHYLDRNFILSSFINLLNNNGVIYDYCHKRFINQLNFWFNEPESIINNKVLVYRNKKQTISSK